MCERGGSGIEFKVDGEDRGGDEISKLVEKEGGLLYEIWHYWGEEVVHKSSN